MLFICDIAVKRVYVDNESIILYQDKAGIVYKTLVFHKYDYPPETTMHAYGEKGTTIVNFYERLGQLLHHCTHRPTRPLHMARKTSVPSKNDFS